MLGVVFSVLFSASVTLTLIRLSIRVVRNLTEKLEMKVIKAIRAYLK